MTDTTALIKLLRQMAHDMRVPLNTLISTSDMLVQGAYDPLTPKQERATARLQRNSHRLLAMLDDFVTYTRADSGDLVLNPKAFDPRAQLDAWCDVIRPAIEEKGLQLRLTHAEAVPAAITGDEVALKRIVQALVWNAVAFTTQGEIQVKADWTPEQMWCISVIDTGSGIPEADLPHIFEPFWRGEARPQLPTAGAGLGLPLARALARFMGGDLVLKETSPQGSHFVLNIPAKNEI
jgi:signal transduction histidine kinase